MLSKDAKERLVIALTDEKIGKEVADAIEGGDNAAALAAAAAAQDDADAAQGDADTALARQAAAVADIADPSTASAEDVANKVNELMAALRAADLLLP